MRSYARAQFIFVTIFLDALGLGLIIPVLPDLLRRFSSEPEFVTQYFGYFISAYSLMQFLASPVLGSLSDRFGRRPVLLVSLLGAGLDYLVMAFAPNLLVLFAGRVIAGLTGANFTVATSYMADISDDSNRASNFGLIGAGFGLGFIVGPAVGGLLGAYGPTTPFLLAAVLNLANFAFGWFVLPESLLAEHRRKVELSKLNPFSSLGKLIRKSPQVLLIWSYFLLFFSGQVHPSVWTLFTETKFGWASQEVGFSLAFVGVTLALSHGLLTRIVIPRWGEIKSVYIGSSIYIAEYIAFAVATKGWMMYAIMTVGATGGVSGPALQSLLSRATPSSEQGELQGSLVSLGSLTAIIGPLVYTNLFAMGQGTVTGTGMQQSWLGIPFFAAAVSGTAALLLFRIHSLKMPRHVRAGS